MYGRGGPPQRGGYYGYNQPNSQYPPQQTYNGAQTSRPSYGRGNSNFISQTWPNQPSASVQNYTSQSTNYNNYPSQSSPNYYQQSYNQQNSHHHHHQPQNPQHHHNPQPYNASQSQNSNLAQNQYRYGSTSENETQQSSNHRLQGPPAGVQRGRGGTFSNLSWTPSAKKSEESSNDDQEIATDTPPIEEAAQNDEADDDDNPFRPPKDMRAEDEDISVRETDREAGKDAFRKPLSFTIKGAADRKDVEKIDLKSRPKQPPATRMVKELIIRKRLKARPQIDPDHINSESVYYRKDGNESVVGSGTYGKVYKAVHVYTKSMVALKKIRMDGERDGFPVTAIREIKLLQSLTHVNVVALQEVMVEKNDCFMIFEYLAHDLTGLLNHPTFTLKESHRKDLAKQLFQGLDYLHRRGVLHRDIKAANILVSKSSQLKLADFGLARFYSKNRKQDYTNRVVTIWYRSPELLLGETQYGPAVDIWSAACVLVEIFTKHAIFPGDGGEINQLDKIYAMLGTPSRSTWLAIVELQWYELLRPTQKLPNVFREKYVGRISPEGFALLESMFAYDPVNRPSAAEILEHKYFTEEEPMAERPVELEGLEGDWHEFESKALRKEKDREARKEKEKERQKDKEKEKGKSSSTGVLEKRSKIENEDLETREAKRLKTDNDQPS